MSPVWGAIAINAPSDVPGINGLEVSAHKKDRSATGRKVLAKDLVRGTAENVWKVQKALEDAGVIFIDEDDKGPGVRLKDPIRNN